MRGKTPSSAHQSALVRELSEASGLGAAVSGGLDFAERLATWLSVADSITLRTTLKTVSSVGQSQSPVAAASSSPPNLAEALERVRTTLTRSITAPEAAPVMRGRADFSSHGAVAAPPMALDPAAEFAMLQQRFVESQRRMEMSIDALRAHVRQVLAQTSPELARLAALDGLMEQMLGGREQHLLSTVPAFLKKRYETLRRQAAAEAQERAGESQPPGAEPTSNASVNVDTNFTWLAQLATDFQQASLAELELRLQPIAGMVEALQSSH